ncbi:hypothetical protein TNCV_2271581 [Trichonephila clavipes]|nr:hypothetical protein TNCV_2271581 [Trichonephila clavipes]
MSLDPSSMVIVTRPTCHWIRPACHCDPRVTTILGDYLCFIGPVQHHWTYPACHLTPVSIVALGIWQETSSPRALKNTCWWEI